MSKIIRVLLLSYCLLFTTTIKAQNGGLFVSNFQLENEAEKWCWAITQDANKHMIIGVAEGVIIFDGINQNLVKIPFVPTKLKFDPETNNIWISGYSHIGVLKPEGIGNYSFHLIHKEEDLEVSKILTLKDEVYFVSPKYILTYNRNNFKSKFRIEAGEEYIEHAFIFHDALHIIKDYFVYRLNKKVWVETSFDFPVDDLAFVLPLSSKKIVASSVDNSLYLIGETSYRTKEIESSPFFDNNLLTDGKIINDTLVAISSIAGGVAIVNLHNYTVYKHMSYFNGLPDEEIRSLFIDDKEGIWISHEFGISRIDLHINIENYSHYPGLKGTPISVKKFNKDVYVGTSDGLFALTEVKDYNESEVSVRYFFNAEVEVESSSKNNESNELFQNSSNKKGFLSRRKKEKNKEIEPVEMSAKKQTKIVRRNRTKTIKKKSLKAISHQYILIEGINDKCRKLITFKNNLFIAGNNGLYVYDGKASKKLIKDAYIVDIYSNSELTSLYIATNNGLYEVFKNDNSWEVDHFSETTDSYLNSLCYEGSENWVLAFSDLVIRAQLINNKIKVRQQVNIEGSSGMTLVVKNINDSTKVYSGKKVHHFKQNGDFELLNEYPSNYRVISTQSDYIWQKFDENWSYSNNANDTLGDLMIQKLKLYKGIRTIDVENNKFVWFIDSDNQIVKINRSNVSYFNEVQLSITKLIANNIPHQEQALLNLPFNQTHVHCGLSAPFYLKQLGVKYSYRLLGLDDIWSDYNENPIIEIRYIPPGNYYLQVKAKNDIGQDSSVKSIKVKVAKPFTQSLWFMLIVVLIIIIIAFLVFKFRMQKLEKDKQKLEVKVMERTQTIEKQKGTLEKQNDEIKQSIRYAERIQRAILPHDEIMDALLPKHFVLFMPRDIVSGDFYFFKPIGNRIIFVAADCTGHGVPGAFMSMLGISFLSEITSQLVNPSAAEIVNHLREKIKITLGQTSIESAQKDGMDLSIAIIDNEKQELEFAGAYNPLFIVKNKELQIIKADRQPVGVHYVETDFTNHIVPMNKGDMFYMFSDGYPDQIGGPKERKFMTKNFKKLLVDISDKPLNQQKKILQKKILDWKGDKMQIDDILVVGFTLE